MNIYRVTTERGFESEILDSALFADKECAMEYAQWLADEKRDTDEYYMCCVSVDKLTSDMEEVFQFEKTLICYEL